MSSKIDESDFVQQSAVVTFAKTNGRRNIRKDQGDVDAAHAILAQT